MSQTVMVTGGSGYIGSWLVKDLLSQGHTVRVMVRNKNNTKKVQHLLDMATDKGKVELWEADLVKAGSFDEAAKGCDVIHHVASPFTLRFKDAQKDLIEPALEGTRNVLNAATASGTVKKVVLTASVAAVHGDNIDMQEQGIDVFNESHWNTSSSATHQPYSYSKVLAEKEAWKIAEAQDQWQLVVINPSFVMGPSLTPNSDSESLQFMRDMLSGKFAMGAPELYFGFVDVRDVARAHILAADDNKAEGRHILAERVSSMLALAQVVEKLFPGKYKLPKKESPKTLLLLMGWMFGLKKSFIRRNVGYAIKVDNSKSIDQLKLQYTPFETTIKDMVEQMEN
jgi:nucleoside-diphosphate-sugar epimerase